MKFGILFIFLFCLVLVNGAAVFLVLEPEKKETTGIEMVSYDNQDSQATGTQDTESNLIEDSSANSDSGGSSSGGDSSSEAQTSSEEDYNSNFLDDYENNEDSDDNPDSGDDTNPDDSNDDSDEDPVPRPENYEETEII
jgi:hypothetical protein